MSVTIKEFSYTELAIVNETLQERYNSAVDVALGDAEIRLNSGDRELVLRPVLFWESPTNKSKFIIMKIGLDRYKCQFFYRGYQQFNTAVDEYDNIGDCVIDMLQVNSEHQTPASVLDNNL